MSVNINDIYHDLKNLVEKTHTAIILEKNNSQINEIKQEIKQEINEKTNNKNIKLSNKNIKLTSEKKTQSCQTTTTKSTDPEKHVYVSLPPAGRKGTKTDNSIMYWSRSLRFPYY